MAANTQQIATRIPDEEKEFIEVFCEENDISISQLIRRAIKEYIERHN